MSTNDRSSNHWLLPTVAAVFLLLVSSCGFAANQSRLRDLRNEHEALEYPYPVVLSGESEGTAGRDFDGHIIDRTLVSRSYDVRDLTMSQVADQTIEWLPSEGWAVINTTCNEEDGTTTAVFIRGEKDVDGWKAQIRLGVSPNEQGGTNIGVIISAPAAGEDELPPPPEPKCQYPPS